MFETRPIAVCRLAGYGCYAGGNSTRNFERLLTVPLRRTQVTSTSVAHPTSPDDFPSPSDTEALYARMVDELRDSGLSTVDVARVVGVAERQVRNWTSAANTPSGRNRDRLLELHYATPASCAQRRHARGRGDLAARTQAQPRRPPPHRPARRGRLRRGARRDRTAGRRNDVRHRDLLAAIAEPRADQTSAAHLSDTASLRWGELKPVPPADAGVRARLRGPVPRETPRSVVVEAYRHLVDDELDDAGALAAVSWSGA